MNVSLDNHLRSWVKFDTPETGWTFKCEGCYYRRAYGGNKILCETKAAAHMVKKNHNLIIYKDGVQMRRLEPSPSADWLFE